MLVNKLSNFIILWQKKNYQIFKKYNKYFLGKLFLKVSSNTNHFIQFIIFGSFIPYTAKIGTNIQLPHQLFGIFISQKAIIGDNCTIMHHVTIGSNYPKKEEAPIIHNNVFVGANACIIGSSVIHKNSQIGAGVTISNKIIPANAIIIAESSVLQQS